MTATRITLGSVVPLNLQLFDGDTGQFPRALIYNNAGALLSTQDLTHVANGLYESVSYNMPQEAAVRVVYIVYSDAGHTTENVKYERSVDSFVLHATFHNGKVYIDTVAGVAGTAYPIGTKEFPVSNEADALTIAGVQNCKAFYIVDGNLTLSQAYLNWEFTCRSALSIIDINGQNVADSVFNYCFLTGTMTGLITADRCIFSALSGFTGYMYDSLHLGTITLASGISVFSDCASAIPGDTAPVIDVGGTGRQVVVRGHSGGIELQNFQSTDEMSADFIAGQLILTASCTGGELTIRGNAFLNNTFGAGTTINGSSDARVTQSSVRDAILNDATKFNGADIAAIKAKTDALPADPASETNVDSNEAKLDTIDTVVDAIKASTDNLPADPASGSAVAAGQAAIIVEVNANEAKIDIIDAAVDAIKAVTDLLPDGGALTTIQDAVVLLRKIRTNIHEFDTDDETMLVRDDNGTSILKKYKYRNRNGDVLEKTDMTLTTPAAVDAMVDP